jgi:hypothetical protein
MQLSSHLDAGRKGDRTEHRDSLRVAMILSGKATGSKPFRHDSGIMTDQPAGADPEKAET